MASKQRAGKSDKNQYTNYQSAQSWKKNKEARLISRLIKNENDTGARDALKALSDGKLTYSRNKFKGKGWFHPQENKLIKESKSEIQSIAKNAREKLAILRFVYTDKRPSAVRSFRNKIKPPVPPATIADQLCNIGIINEKRRDIVNTRMGSIRTRRTVSNRR